jgi:hypothetical protein
MESTFSRSRKQYQNTVSAPMSMACVPSQTQCELMRVSSVSSTRIASTRSGTRTPSSFSADRHSARLLLSGEM